VALLLYRVPAPAVAADDHIIRRDASHPGYGNVNAGRSAPRGAGWGPACGSTPAERNSAFMVDFTGEQINRRDLYARICHNCLSAVPRKPRGSRGGATKNADPGFAIQAVFR
jgi:hypothetical protein